MMKSPFETTWTFPKFYGVVEVRVEKSLQLTENCYSVKLERMGFTVKNFLYSVNEISYDNDLRDSILGTGLVDTIPDGEQFCFSACHK